MTASPLEIRYRRLLRAYPADHRDSHGEEMLGVLMATAGPGRRRPSLADTGDLLRGALLLRLRRSASHYRRREWRDGLALVSLLAPLILLVQTANYGCWLALGLFGPDDVRFGREIDWQNDLYTAPVWVACGLLAAAALLGARRTTAVLAFGTAAVSLTSPFWSAAFFDHTFWYSSGPEAIVVTLTLLSGCAAVFSDGPRRARALMGRWGTAIAAVLSLSAMTVPNLGELLPEALHPGVLEAVPILVTAFGAPVWLLLTAPGRRAFVILLVGFSPFASGIAVFGAESTLGSVIISVIVVPALTVGVLLAGRAIVRTMRRRGLTASPVRDRDQDGTPLAPA